jgi:hypothetical protein
MLPLTLASRLFVDGSRSICGRSCLRLGLRIGVLHVLDQLAGKLLGGNWRMPAEHESGGRN